MKTKNKKIFFLFVLVTILLLSLAYTPYFLPNDLFYDIKIGDFILQHGIDLKDHFSYVSFLPYTYPHWGFDVILSIIYRNFSYDGIHIFLIICCFFLLLLSYGLSLRMNKNDNHLTSYLSLFLIGSFMKNGITPRAQVLSYLLFIIQIYVLETFLQKKNKRILFLLPILSFLLANIHGTIWPFFFILFLPYIMEWLCFKYLKKKNINIKTYNKKLFVENFSSFRVVFLFIFLSFLVGFFTPSFGIALTYFIKIMHTTTVHFILEHQPLILANNIQYFLLLLCLFFLFILSKTKIRVRDFFMIFGLIFASFFSIRHTFLFACCGLVFFFRYLNDLLNEESSNTMDILYSHLQKPIVEVILLLFLVFFAYSSVEQNKAKREKLEEYPMGAVSYINQNVDKKSMRIFNQYEDGGYLLFNDIKVFIDSRSDLYTKEFNKKMDIFDDYIQVDRKLEYKKVFEKYKITHVLLIKNSSIEKLLSMDTSYKNIYTDEKFVLYEKQK